MNCHFKTFAALSQVAGIAGLSNAASTSSIVSGAPCVGNEEIVGSINKEPTTRSSGCGRLNNVSMVPEIISNVQAPKNIISSIPTASTESHNERKSEDAGISAALTFTSEHVDFNSVNQTRIGQKGGLSEMSSKSNSTRDNLTTASNFDTLVGSDGVETKNKVDSNIVTHKSGVCNGPCCSGAKVHMNVTTEVREDKNTLYSSNASTNHSGALKIQSRHSEITDGVRDVHTRQDSNIRAITGRANEFTSISHSGKTGVADESFGKGEGSNYTNIVSEHPAGIKSRLQVHNSLDSNIIRVTPVLLKSAKNDIRSICKRSSRKSTTSF